jgi:hypothetical protein
MRDDGCHAVRAGITVRTFTLGGAIVDALSRVPDEGVLDVDRRAVLRRRPIRVPPTVTGAESRLLNVLRCENEVNTVRIPTTVLVESTELGEIIVQNPNDVRIRQDSVLAERIAVKNVSLSEDAVRNRMSVPVGVSRVDIEIG